MKRNNKGQRVCINCHDRPADTTHFCNVCVAILREREKERTR